MIRPSVCRIPCWNPFSITKDELARAAPKPAPTKGSNTFTLAFAVSRVPTLALPVASVVASSLAAALAVTALFLDNELFKQFRKAYLKI